MYSFLNYITWDIDPIIFTIGSYSLRYYTVCFLLAFISAYVVMLRIFKREGKPQELLDQLTIYIFLGTLIGARLGHCLFYEFDYYIKHPLEMILPVQFTDDGIQVTGFQGLASHGGALGILTALFLFSRKTKTDFLWITDRIVIVVALAGAFVRLGNFFNSEIIGRPTDVPWAVIFSRVDMQPRHPSQFYEAVCYILIFILLYRIYLTKQNLKPGYIFGIFLITLFGARFAIEFLKENQESFEDAMSYNMGQLLSIPFIILGVYFLFRKPPPAKAVKKRA